MDDLYVRHKSYIAGRRAAMWEGHDSDFIGCYNCGEEGHFQQDCWKFRSKGGGMNNQTKGKKGTPTSRGTTPPRRKGQEVVFDAHEHYHNDSDCFEEWAPRPEKDTVNVAAAQCHCCPSVAIASHERFLFTTVPSG